MESSSREQQLQIVRVRNSWDDAVGSGAAGNSSEEREDDDDEEEEEGGETSRRRQSRSALSAFRAKEEEIERKKSEVREKVFMQLGRVEEETKRLAFIRQELEGMADPTRKEVEAVRKRIDTVNRQLKPLGKTCLKKEKEYRECVEAFNEKSKEKALLVNRLMELVSQSERLRMKKLEELNKTIDSLH